MINCENEHLNVFRIITEFEIFEKRYTSLANLVFIYIKHQKYIYTILPVNNQLI